MRHRDVTEQIGLPTMKQNISVGPELTKNLDSD